jgi:transcriptional regulator with XRE-family HTH domain
MENMIDQDVFRVALGRNVAKLRNEQHLSQESLAEKAGLHRVTVAKIENGRMIPAAHILVNIAQALSVSTDALTTF